LGAVFELRARGGQARERLAFEQGAKVVDALAGRVGQLFTREALEQLGPAEATSLRGFQASLITPLVDASAGFCVPDGDLLAVETVAPTAFAPTEDAELAREFRLRAAARLLPLDRRIVQRACNNLSARQFRHDRFAAPNDLLFVSARRLNPSLGVFALVRMPNRDHAERGWTWQANVVLLCACALLLAWLTIDALIALRRSTSQVESSLARLSHDLRADIASPRIAELAQIAAALRMMAADLATTRERERSLEGRLAHEQRLAGLGRVVAGVAHEIRNPLAAMKLNLDLMARRDLEPRTRREIGTCLMEVARLERVVSTLLLVSRREQVERATCDLGALIRERAEASRPAAWKRGVRIEVQGEGGALGHREYLVHIVDNLLRNAVEASPDGGRVCLALRHCGRELELSICDAGAGVPSEHVERLFEPFFTLKPDGTGLGLFLSRSLAEAQRGTVSYAREAARSYFKLTLERV
jgi:signal transduction histidine kinase